MTDILPIGASALERAIDAGEAARIAAIDLRAITDAADPWRCPVDQLGYLAFAWSLDLWDEAWPEARKRSAIAAALQLHRLKGTLAGIRAHVALVGAEVRGAVRPPARGFWRGSIDAEAHAARLAALPQLRFYPFANQAVARRRLFLTGGRARRGWYRGAWTRGALGPELRGVRATFWRDGVEVPIVPIETDGEIRVMLPGVRHNASWLTPGRLDFLRSSRAAQDVVAFRPNPTRSAYAITRGAAAAEVAPTRVFEPRPVGRHRSFVGRRLRFLRRPIGPMMVYDRYSIAMPAPANIRRGRMWHGHGRYGIRPFTAELQLVVSLRRPRQACGRWYGRGFWHATDMRPASAAIEAVRVSKAARDTILLDTASHGPATFRAGARFGDPSFSAFGGRMRNF